MSEKKIRASEALLGQLHEAIAAELLRRVLAGEASTADLNVGLKMLKDNDIEALITEDSDLQKLWESLPKFNDDEEYAN
jgi:hypothetical protein